MSRIEGTLIGYEIYRGKLADLRFSLYNLGYWGEQAIENGGVIQIFLDSETIGALDNHRSIRDAWCSAKEKIVERLKRMKINARKFVQPPGGQETLILYIDGI